MHPKAVESIVEVAKIAKGSKIDDPLFECRYSSSEFLQVHRPRRLVEHFLPKWRSIVLYGSSRIAGERSENI